MLCNRLRLFALIGMLLLLLARVAAGAEIPLKVNGKDYVSPVALTATPAEPAKVGSYKVSLTFQPAAPAAVPVKQLKLTPGSIDYTSADGKITQKLDASHLLPDKTEFTDLVADKPVTVNIGLSDIPAAGKCTTKLRLGSDADTFAPAEILLEITISAATPTPPQLTSPVTTLSVISPELAVFATQGDSPSIVNLSLHGGGADITDVTLASVDLRSADKQHLFSASHIVFERGDLSKDQGKSIEIKRNGDAKIPVTITTNGTDCGQYAGSLYARYGRDSSLAIPISINVRTGPLWPVVWLFTGVILSLGLGWYRGQKLVGDQILADVADLRVKIMREPAFQQGKPPASAAFRDNIDSSLMAAETQVDARKWWDVDTKKWDAARTSFEAALALWVKWEQYRPDWVTQFTRLAQTRAIVDEQFNARRTHYLETLREALDKVGTEASQNFPTDMRAKLDTLRDQLYLYTDLQTDLTGLDKAIGGLPALAQKDFPDRAKTLRQNLENSVSSDMTEITHTEQKKAIQVLWMQVTGAPVVTGLESDRLSEPSVNIPTFSQPVLLQAKQRLVAYNWFVYLLAVFLTASGGFIILYVANPFFGSSLYRDIFSLFLWGFGADQVSRATITSTITSLGLPVAK